MLKNQMIPSPDAVKNNRLYIALELSNGKWKVAFGNGFKIRINSIAARDLQQFKFVLEKAKKHFGMGDDVEIYCCYEAGRDGFWIHRCLVEIGIHNMVVDSSSIEVNRRFRRAKTDRIDATKLLTMLIRYINGETKLWSVLHVPTPEEEDIRRLNREAERLKKERAAHTNRIKSLLVLHGIVMGVGKSFEEDIDKIMLWNGERLPSQIKAEMLREFSRYKMINEQLKCVKTEKERYLKENGRWSQKVIGLEKLKGIGPVSAEKLVSEFFGWREFNNVKEVGAASGLAPMPYDSGTSQKDQGISKSGNRRVRALMIELSWFWLRYQPISELSKWFMERFGHGSKRMRRVGIVALARKLLIALWKYLEKGIVPEGATIEP